MQINKKLITTLIIAMFAISTILSALPMVSAEITAPPTLDVATGPVGTDVVVTGAAGTASPFATVTAYWDSLAGTVLGTTSALSTGAYELEVTIPPAVYGTHFIVVNDGETESAGAAFDVTGQLIVNTVPATSGTPMVLPGDQLKVDGHGFAAGDTITLTFDSTTLGTSVTFDIVTPVITSNATGSFSATITIPATLTLADFDTYTVTAADEATNTATATVIIDYYIGCVPSAGPVGITTTISGRIAPNMAYVLRFNGAQISSGTTAADGSYMGTYTVPAVLSVGAYSVDIVWATVNSRATTFTVNPSPVIVLGAANGIAGDTVTITGSGFSASADVTLFFGSVSVNDTTMDFGPTTNTGALPAGLTFVVPTLAPGIYSVTVVDEYGATSAVAYFTIDPTPYFTVATRAMEYMQMDFISLTSTASSAADVVLRFTDPTGLVWFSEAISATQWQALAGAYQIPYDQTSLTWWPIPSDAPVGTWNFTCYNAGMTQILDTNLFTVVAKPSQQDVLNALDDLEGTIQNIVTTSEGKIMALITTRTGTITTDIAKLNPLITAIDDTVMTIQTDLGLVQVAVDDIDMGTMGVDITSIKGDVATIKSNIGSVTTAVSNLDAKVTSVSGDVATVNTKLGTLEGKITTIDGNTATIKTDVGTLQADVSDVKAKPDVDMTPAWIAVVLSLVAAIAAIFAVITIRQKIAG